MKKIKIGIAGLGVVGQGVYEILQEEAKNLSQKSGFEFEVVAVASRTSKSFLSSSVKFYDDILQIAKDPEIDIVVELVGGVEIAKELVFLAIKNGKKVVTANKALFALHGKEIADLCKNSPTKLGFEASVAGANPVIKAFLESFVANKIDHFVGILNGTCNFILSKMAKEKRGYFEVLAEAQKMGFAEANPALDVEGFDAAHKTAILAAIASGRLLDFSDVYVEGIEKISSTDIELAAQLGYAIKLLGVFRTSSKPSNYDERLTNFSAPSPQPDFEKVPETFKNLEAKNENSEQIFVGVYPALISLNEKIAQIDGSYNCLLTHGSNFEWNMMIGRGAGGRPTGSAIVSDIVDIAAGRGHSSILGSTSENHPQLLCQKVSSRFGRYFLRFDFLPGHAVDQNLLEKMLQDGLKTTSATFLENKIDKKNSEDEAQTQISCAFLTENISEAKIAKSLQALDKTALSLVKFIRVEETGF